MRNRYFLCVWIIVYYFNILYGILLLINGIYIYDFFKKFIKFWGRYNFFNL